MDQGDQGWHGSGDNGMVGSTMDDSGAARAQRIAKARHLARSGQAQQIRLKAGLSQGEVARLLDVDPSAVSRWEAGLRSPRDEVARRYLDLLTGLLAS
jgi:transcriptional regulator with XRE-family HTH domain